MRVTIPLSKSSTVVLPTKGTPCEVLTGGSYVIPRGGNAPPLLACKTSLLLLQQRGIKVHDDGIEPSPFFLSGRPCLLWPPTYVVDIIDTAITPIMIQNAFFLVTTPTPQLPVRDLHPQPTHSK